jgi:transcriptional regulatory protein LEU3
MILNYSMLIVIIRTCSGSGQANLVAFEVCNEQIQLKSLLDKLPVTLRVQIQIGDIITRAHKSLLDLGLLSMTPQQERTMDALLKGFNSELDILENLVLTTEDQVQDVIPKADPRSVWDRLYIAFARQDLVVMHFYKSATALDLQSCLLIFNVISSVLEQVCDLGRDHGLHLVCTRYILTATLVSLASMARILKGPFAKFLDQTRGHSLFDNTVSFVRSSSIQKADFGDRGAAYAEQIWKSKKVFRNPDGSINITLRVRNRLSCGPLHDVVRCWKEEFIESEIMHSAPEMNIGTLLPTLVSSEANVDAETVILSSATPHVPLSTSSDLFLSDELWGDFGLTDSWDLTGSSMNWMA